MMCSWQKEKGYTERRAQQLGQEMEEAIEAKDRERFLAAHTTAMRYMKKKERGDYYRRFLQMMIERS